MHGRMHLCISDICLIASVHYLWWIHVATLAIKGRPGYIYYPMVGLGGVVPFPVSEHSRKNIHRHYISWVYSGIVGLHGSTQPQTTRRLLHTSNMIIYCFDSWVYSLSIKEKGRPRLYIRKAVPSKTNTTIPSAFWKTMPWTPESSFRMRF